MKVKKAYIILPTLFSTMVLIFLMIRINQLEDRVMVLEDNNENKITALNDVNGALDSFQNKLDTF